MKGSCECYLGREFSKDVSVGGGACRILLCGCARSAALVSSVWMCDVVDLPAEVGGRESSMEV